jgi:TIGR03009 family protein
MRILGQSLAAALLVAAVASAQTPPENPPALDPARDRLDALLLKWESAMKQYESILVEATRVEVSKVTGFTDTYNGQARYMRPGLALVYLQNKDRNEVYEKFLLTPTFAVHELSRDKVVRVYELPPPKEGQVSDDNVLGILLGMKAAEAKRRYELKLAKEDQWYVYVDIEPRFAADKEEFQRARLVLNIQTMLPRQLWFLRNNGDETHWDLPRVLTGGNSGITRRDFDRSPVPAGWKEERIRPEPAHPARPTPGQTTSQPQPRIIRPNQ